MANGLLDVLRQLQLPANFIPNMPDMSQQQPDQQPVMPQTPAAAPMTAPVAPPVAMPSNGSGFMGWLNSDAGRSLIGGVGAGLLAKMQNRNDPIVPTVFAAADQYKKQFAQKALVDQITNNPNYTPQQKQILSYGIQNDPKILESATKSLFPTGNSRTTNAIVNAQAVGLKPGTKDYNDYIREQTTGRYNTALTKDEQAFKNSVAKQTGFQGDQLDDAVQSYKTNGNQLPDGSALPTLNEEGSAYLDSIQKRRSTATLINKGVQANQADAELDAITQHITPVIQKTGTIYANKSMAQISDQFKSDPASQKDLGDIIGARGLQYAIAQLRNRIDMGEPGINATQELMKNSGQYFDLLNFKLSPEARLEAQTYINAGVKKALAARNKVGVNASAATGNANTSSQQPKLSEEDIQYNIHTYKKTRQQVLDAAKEQGYS